MRIAAILVLYVLCVAATSRAAVTYRNEIAPILLEHCAPCHCPGQPGPFPLLTYEDARRHAREIAVVTRRRYMPPWLPQPGYGEFVNQRRLSDRQLSLIQDWVRNGAAEGSAPDRTPPASFASDWQLGPPDFVIQTTGTLVLPAAGPDIFWNFVLSPVLGDGRFVKAVEIRPANTRVVHHANLVIDRARSSRRREKMPGEGFEGMDLTFEADTFDPDSHFLFWKPGGTPNSEPAGRAWRLNPGNDLILNVHLKPSGKPEPVQLAVGLYFTDTPPSQFPMLIKLENDRALDIAAGSRDFLIADDFRLPIDVDVLAVYPHAHYLGKLLEAYATLPDGSRKWLIRIPEWDVNWQGVFQCRAPLFLPRGSVVSMRYHYDNSAGNPRNPNSPPKRVRSGNQSTDEMGHLWLQVLPRGAGDQRPALQEALLRHRIEKYPDDGSAHLGLGTLLLSRKDIAGAIRHLRLAPESAQAHNNLGAALKIEGQLDAAAEAFRRALQIQPGYANARFNLGTTFAAQGRPEEAAAEFRHVFAAIPQDREARDQLTAILVGIGDAAAYRELVALEPQNADYRNNLGILLVRTGNIAGAIEQFEAALQVNPNHAAARRNLDQIRRRNQQ
jgi:Flp pilus assembly protein TadD